MSHGTLLEFQMVGATICLSLIAPRFYYFLIPLSKLQGFVHDANAHPLKLVFFNQLSFIHFDNEHQLAKTICANERTNEGKGKW